MNIGFRPKRTAPDDLPTDPSVPPQGMKGERIQVPATITMTWTLGGDQIAHHQLLELAKSGVVAEARSHVHLKKPVHYRYFASAHAFVRRLLERGQATKAPTQVELHVLADPAKSREAGELLQKLVQLANG